MQRSQAGSPVVVRDRESEALGEALVGSNRPLVITSGTAGVSSDPDGIATEKSPLNSKAGAAPRMLAEATALSLTSRGVRVSIVRLPQVHGDHDHGFVRILINTARSKGLSTYIGDGTNRWPSVHVLDAAVLYRLALERAPAGSILHAVDDEGVALRDIASIISTRLNVPLVSKSSEEASENFGFLARMVALDNPTSSAATRELLGWTPTHPKLLAQLDTEEYVKG